MIILQITGKVGAGKTDLCAYLAKKHGFTVVLISDLIREFARAKGLTLAARADYLEVHKQMKNEQGEDIILQKILATPGKNICVDGIRVPNDVKRLQAAGAKIVALDCPAEVRFTRSLKRRSSLDKPTFEAFMADDQAEAHNTDLECQGTDAVMAMADYRIDASQSQDDVFRAIDQIVSAVGIA